MAGKVMRALQYSGYGGGVAALKHVELPVPSPKKDEVLIKVEAAALNPIDWKIQNGVMRPFQPSKFPHVPVTDTSGEVIEVGSGVTKFKAGDKVVAMLDNFSGGLAEFAVAKEKLTVKRPEQISAAEGAGLIAAGLAAHQALTAGGVSLDGTGKIKNVLVTAASGGVGHYAVQLAKLGGHHVTATCGARNLEFVKNLGADEVLDYKTPEGAALKSPSGKKYDVVINCAEGISWSTYQRNLSEYGKVVNLPASGSTMWTFVVKKVTFSKKKMVMVFLSPNGITLEYLVGLAGEGKLKTTVDSTFPLSKAEDAWGKCIESHATGKIIVEP
ncbi:chloroplast envelope quinone oxidoreductase homolog [Aristolochia californica]|uniref:chloroplast envelope quinone oxidoreductase homolog n=1 Tax=Aristolochia californica TaxID=171875 RepID=UPI0035DADB54